MADDSSSCCPPGSLPALQEDTARELSGELVNDKLYYSAPPSASTKGILVIYDVFGFSGGRIKSVCDQLALAGFHVAMPDSYEGERVCNVCVLCSFYRSIRRSDPSIRNVVDF